MVWKCFHAYDQLLPTFMGEILYILPTQVCLPSADHAFRSRLCHLRFSTQLDRLHHWTSYCWNGKRRYPIRRHRSHGFGCAFGKEASLQWLLQCCPRNVLCGRTASRRCFHDQCQLEMVLLYQPPYWRYRDARHSLRIETHATSGTWADNPTATGQIRSIG